MAGATALEGSAVRGTAARAAAVEGVVVEGVVVGATEGSGQGGVESGRAGAGCVSGYRWSV